jgi:hypothetical protein
MRFSLKPSSSRRRTPVWRRMAVDRSVHLHLESLEDRRLLTVFVTSKLDSGPGTLRQLILDADSGGDANIRFNIAGGGLQTISLTSGPLPALTVPAVIDATSQPGYFLGGPPMVEISGANTFGGDGLDLDAGASTVKGLAIDAFVSNAIGLFNIGGDTIQQCYLGTSPDGKFARPNSNGIDIEFGADNNTIGGTTVAERNVISGNIFDGILIDFANNNKIQDNYIGTDATGTVALGNGFGINVTGGANNVFGGTTHGIQDTDANTGNLISGNLSDGLVLTDSATNNTVLGNYIGLDKTGTVGLGNSGNGINISFGSNQNTIGGTVMNGGIDLSANYLSGNQAAGISVAQSDRNVIEGNLIGFTADTSGTATEGNVTAGVVLAGATNTTVGGTLLNGGMNPARNFIGGNKADGLDIVGGDHNTILGNYIGTDPGGTVAVPNFANGIGISGGATNNLIGGITLNGTTNVAGNLIAGNTQSGIYISDSTTNNNVVQGNDIGAYFDDMSRTTKALPNGANGITIFDEAHSNVIGGTVLSGTVNISGNLISGNTAFGVQIDHENGTSGNVVEGNFIGTDITGTVAVPNMYGVGISGGAQGNIIGGTFVQSGIHSSRNIISGNTKYGVGLFDRFTSGNVVEDNYIGTEVTGTVALPNFDGVALYDAASGNFVGQTVTAGTIHNFYGNRICGNTSAGVHLYDSGTAGNVVQNNYVGVYLDAASNTQILPNGVGVDFSGGAGGTDFAKTPNVIGTVTNNPDGTPIDPKMIVASPNFISGNLNYGVGLHDPNTSFNVVQGNYIGTDISGTQTLADSTQPYGVAIFGAASKNLIGGTAQMGNTVLVNASRNLISGNLSDGVFIEGTMFGATTVGNIVEGNYIGTDKSGLFPLANGGNGINIFFKALNSQIGGTALNADQTANVAGNLISANALEGICISGASTGTTILGNSIGVDSNENALTNGLNGIHVQDTSNGTTIGDGGLLDGNTIWYNGANFGTTGGDAILIDTAINNRIEGNSIAYHDPNIGIDLINGANGVFSNGALLPTVTGATVNAPTDVNITYTFTDPNWANQVVYLDFYATEVGNGSGFGEGRVYLGQIIETLDATGATVINMVDLMLPPGSPVQPGWVITATATEVDMTDPNNFVYNTSQFSGGITSAVPGTTPGDPSLGGAIQPVGGIDPVQPIRLRPVTLGNLLQALSVQTVDPGQFDAAPGNQPVNGSSQTLAPDHQGRDWVFAHHAMLSDFGLPGWNGVLEGALSGVW